MAVDSLEAKFVRVEDGTRNLQFQLAYLCVFLTVLNYATSHWQRYINESANIHFVNARSGLEGPIFSTHLFYGNNIFEQ